jgi:hypothetical protein
MYGKIFEIMYEGSLYGQWEAIVTFQQMIVIADDEGFVDITPQALAAKTSIPLDIIIKGIEVLESDDPYSRTKGQDGKRILRIDKGRPWGWQIVNYIKYRNMTSHEDRKAYMRDYMKKRRKQKKLTRKQDVNTRKQTVADVTHTDTDTDTDTDKNTIDEGATIYKFYISEIAPLKKSRPRALKNINRWLKKHSVEDLIQAIKNYKTVCCENKPKYRKDPANFFGINEVFHIDYLQENFQPKNSQQIPVVPKKQPTIEELFSND